MRSFFDGQGHTRIYAEAYTEYVAGKNPRRTKFIGKRTIYVRKPSVISVYERFAVIRE
jgi:hypothetical protein